MRRKYCLHTLFLILLYGCSIPSFSQSVGIGTVTPDPSAILDVHSTDKGILIPRMTQEERENIDSPADGLMVYQTDEKQGFWYYSSTTEMWKQIPKSNSNTISLNSNTPITLGYDGFYPRKAGIIGNGSSVSNISMLIPPGSFRNLQSGGLSEDPNIPLSIAFTVPQHSILTSINATFKTISPVSIIGQSVSIHLGLYGENGGLPIARIPVTQDTPQPFPRATFFLNPSLSGEVSAGTHFSFSTSGLSIPLYSSVRYLLAFYIERGGDLSSNELEIVGYGSANIVVE